MNWPVIISATIGWTIFAFLYLGLGCHIANDIFDYFKAFRKPTLWSYALRVITVFIWPLFFIISGIIIGIKLIYKGIINTVKDLFAND